MREGSSVAPTLRSNRTEALKTRAQSGAFLQGPGQGPRQAPASADPALGPRAAGLLPRAPPRTPGWGV